MTTIVCVGGGIVGVFAALRARQLRPRSRVLLIEQGEALGGLLMSDPHPSGLHFDRGTHILSETGSNDIDALLFSRLETKDWHILEGPNRDLAGIFLDDKIREGSPFLPVPPIQDNCLRVYRSAVSQGSEATLSEWLVGRHGQEVTETVFRQPLRRLYGFDIEQLDPFVAAQLPLSRIVADDMATWLTKVGDDVYRSLIACPDQKSLPAEYASPLRGMYPKRMGVGRLFDTLSRQLQSANVETYLSQKLSALNVENGRVKGVQISSRDSTKLKVEGDLELVWAAAPFALARLLGVPLANWIPKPQWRSLVADFFIPRIRSLDCYYYVDYDDNDAFRLTNYSALSEEAAGSKAAPMSLELWWRVVDQSPNTIGKAIASRLGQIGLISNDQDLTGLRIRTTEQNVPSATVENINALSEIGRAVKHASPCNLMNVGLLAEPRLFFTSEILRNAEQLLSLRLD